MSVSGGALHLMATSSSQGGVQFYGNPQTYGMYLVRMKGDNEPGLAINNLALLSQAQQGVWPPEVDFFEDEGGSRQNFNASLHAGPDGNYSCCVVHSPDEDSNGTTWHTYGVQWTPDTMTYTIDGRVSGQRLQKFGGLPRPEVAQRSHEPVPAVAEPDLGTAQWHHRDHDGRLGGRVRDERLSGPRLADRA